MTEPLQVLELLSLVEKIYNQGELEPFIDLVQTPKRVLIYLNGKDKVRPSEIGESLRMSRPSVTTHLKGLEQEGLITREINPDNRREVYVSLTDAGREAFENLIGRLVSLFQDWLTILGPEAEHLFRILRISSDLSLVGEGFKSVFASLRTEEPYQEDEE